MYLIGQLLQLTPTDEIIFRREDGETTGLLTMSNAVDCSVAYKVLIFLKTILFSILIFFKCPIKTQIKTTSPDKYRVRPSAGVIAVGATLTVTVHIQVMKS